jgi:hypothetical protein
MSVFRFTLSTAAITAIVGLLAVSTQSLWIDEANSAVKAMSPSFTAFVDTMSGDRGSDLQMPLYMFMLWGWEKIFGHSEFALRAMNVPLFVLAMVIAAGAWQTTGTRRVLFVVFACSSAFVWAYLDEARPYILQFLGANACAIPLANAANASKAPRSLDISFFTAGVLILCGSSLLGVVSSFWFSLAFLVLWLMKQTLTEALKRTDLRIAVIISLPVLLILGSYYLWTLSLGAGASSVGSTSILSMAYAGYELLGMAGLGPGRSELRSSPAALLGFAPYLLIYATSLWLLLCTGIVISLRQSFATTEKKGLVVFWMAPLAVVATTTMIGIVGDFRVVGRHLTPLLPFILILFSAAATTLWGARHCVMSRGITILAILSLLTSAMAYRISKRHDKDDYRTAATLAHETLAEGGTVWWAADPAGANYYGLEISDRNSLATLAEPSVLLVSNLAAPQAPHLPQPDLVVLSKADVYDDRGHLQAWLEQNRYALRHTIKSFQIFEPTGPYEH